MPQAQQRQSIPTYLTLEEFQEFVLPHLHISRFSLYRGQVEIAWIAYSKKF